MTILIIRAVLLGLGVYTLIAAVIMAHMAGGVASRGQSLKVHQAGIVVGAIAWAAFWALGQWRLAL